MPAAETARRLNAGPVTAVWDGGSLRWIERDGVELLRSIQVTARDSVWTSLAPEISRAHVRATGDEFSIRFHMRCAAPGFDVEADIRLDGTPEGRIVATFSGLAGADTVAQRIGLIVLHPSDVAGARFEARSDDLVTPGSFPRSIVAERLATGIRSMTWKPAEHLEATIAYTGTAWEIEDQRAWTDASFKSYTPPLSQPHPFRLGAGERVEQSVLLDVVAVPGAPVRIDASNGPRPLMEIVVSDTGYGPVPPIGLGWSDHRLGSDAARLRATQPSHLRVILDRLDDSWPADLRAAAGDARALGCKLQLELVSFDESAGLERLLAVLAENPVAVAGVLTFGSQDDDGLMTSDPAAIARVRQGLVDAGHRIVVGGGTRANYAELIARPVAVGPLEEVAFAVCPQIHAFDDATILENLTTLAAMTRDARSLAGGHPIDVLCSLRPRFNAYATPPERALSTTRIDPRFRSRFGAAWLLGTLAGVMSGPVARVTVAEAVGPAGIMPRADEMDDDHGFPLELLSAIGEVRAGVLMRLVAPPGVAALAIRDDGLTRLFAVNLRDHPIEIRTNIPARSVVSRRRLGSRIVADPRPADLSDGLSRAGGPEALVLDLDPLDCWVVDVDPA